jgi:hypothetical protein
MFTPSDFYCGHCYLAQHPTKLADEAKKICCDEEGLVPKDMHV